VTPCSVVGKYLHFEGTLLLISHPEDGESIFLPDHMPSHHRTP
jgi:hypothetical protein